MSKTKEVRRLSKWANKNYPEFQYEYALKLLNGEGTKENKALGTYFMTASACNGYPKAIEYLNTKNSPSN